MPIATERESCVCTRELGDRLVFNVGYGPRTVTVEHRDGPPHCVLKIGTAPASRLLRRCGLTRMN